MEKLKKFISRIPLMPALIIVMSFFIILAVILSKTTMSYANEQIQLIGAKYTVFAETTNVSDELEHSVVHYVYIDVLPFSEEDKQAYDFYTMIYEYSSFFWCIVSITIGAVIFYFGKLKKPIKLLINASENISDDNLDFVIDYNGNDELGQLCSSFEKMRLSLQNNNRTMWRMIEERRKLNKAFSHELRTPLTVMRGNVELLEKVYMRADVSEDKKEAILSTVSKNIERIENYVYSMGTMNKLEDQSIQIRCTNTDSLSNQLEKSLEMLCQENNLESHFEILAESENINVDANIIMQVFENIVSNAVRYAKESVTVSFCVSEDYLTISVSDDGTGFSEEELKAATAPYYTGNPNDRELHFGLGLYLCKILCEKHKGALKLTNNDGAGACVIASFSCK